MADPAKWLPVQWHKQERGFYCGPACLQMILEFFAVVRTQDQLFGRVKALSDGERPADAPCDANHACYPTQVCDLCGTWECWDTDPKALTATANELAPPGTGYQLRYASTFLDGTQLLIDSLKPAHAVPPVTTVESFNHWIVVNGYHLEDPDHLEGRPDDEHPPINGLYLLDPLEEDEGQRLRLVPMSEWRRRFGIIDCGPHTDDYVVVVGPGVGKRPLRARKTKR